MVTRLRVEDLDSDASLESGSHLNPERVSYYARANALPPVVVYETPQGRLLVDGHHRLAAAKRRGAATVDAEVRRGSRHDALLYAAEKAAKERGTSRRDAIEHIKRRSKPTPATASRG